MIETGVFFDRCMSEHRAIPLPSPSGLGELARSPAAWLYRQGHPIDPSPQMKFGTLVHGLALEGKLPDGWVVRPSGLDFRTKEGRAWREQLPPGAEIVDEEDYDRAQAAADSVRSHPAVAAWLESGDAEVSLVWIDSETGVRMKGRADLVAPDPVLGWVVADLKLLSVGPDLAQVSKAVWAARYDRQLAPYADGLETLTGHRHTAVIIACDPQPPHGVGVYPLSPLYQARGLREARQLLAIFQACQDSGEWPADDRDLSPIGAEINPPRWAEEEI